MEHIDGVLGNITEDESLARRIHEHDAAGTLERVTIEAGDRQRSRLRVETDAGTDLGLVPDRELRSGDVLILEADRAVVVEFESREAAVIPLPEATQSSLALVSELGHRIGNQHWDLAIHDGALYVPVAADREIIEEVLGPHLPPGAEISYGDVNAGLWIDGGSDPGGHDPDHAGHNHSHVEHDHDHSHDHSRMDHDHDQEERDYTGANDG